MRKIILTGYRPTGRLHIGHYVGSLMRRVELQNSGKFDEINILNATKRAFAQAYADMGTNADIALIDAVDGLDIPCRKVPIIHGDALSYSIACASIMAKVTRDRMPDPAAE